MLIGSIILLVVSTSTRSWDVSLVILSCFIVLISCFVVIQYFRYDTLKIKPTSTRSWDSYNILAGNIKLTAWSGCSLQERMRWLWAMEWWWVGLPFLKEWQKHRAHGHQRKDLKHVSAPCQFFRVLKKRPGSGLWSKGRVLGGWSAEVFASYL